MVVTSLTNVKLVCKNGIKTLRLCSSYITLKMSYSKCGLCLQDLQVIKPASGIRYIRCLNCTCPFFCPEENINGYQHCIYDHVVPEYKVCEGGKPLKCKKKKKCKHMDTPTLRVMRSVNNPFRPYFTCRRKEMCKYFQWADEIPVHTYYEREPPVYNPEETAKEEIIQRPKLVRQFARTDNLTDSL